MPVSSSCFSFSHSLTISLSCSFPYSDWLPSPFRNWNATPSISFGFLFLRSVSFYLYEPRIPRNAATTESKASPDRPYVRYWATNSAQVNRHHDVDVESNASNYYVLLSAFDTRNKFWPTFRFRISRQVQLFQCQYLCSSSDSKLNEADDILKAKY